jgi:hypothetical protein
MKSLLVLVLAGVLLLCTADDTENNPSEIEPMPADSQTMGTHDLPRTIVEWEAVLREDGEIGLIDLPDIDLEDVYKEPVSWSYPVNSADVRLSMLERRMKVLCELLRDRAYVTEFTGKVTFLGNMEMKKVRSSIYDQLCGDVIVPSCTEIKQDLTDTYSRMQGDCNFESDNMDLLNFINK